MPSYSSLILTYRTDSENNVISNLCMVLSVQNPLTDPPPTAPVVGATANLILSEQDDNNNDFDLGIRTTNFWYETPAEWELHTDRVADAVLPYTFPTNVFNYTYKDARDTFQGFTSLIWFTV